MLFLKRGKQLPLALALIGLLWASAVAASGAKDPRQVIVASRAGVSVTLYEVDAQVMALPRALRAKYLDDPERLEEVVLGLLTNKQLAKRAVEAGVESDPYLETQLQAAREEWLARRARNLHEDSVVENQPDFTQLAEEIYKSHPHRFRRPVTLQLRHILVRIGGRGEEAALARAKEARDAMLAGEREFKDIYLNYSDEAADPRLRGSGVLNDVIPGLTEPAFEEEVFKLTEVGQISEIIRTTYGFHVAQLMKREEPSMRTMEEVLPTLAAEQQQKHLNERKAQLLAEIQSSPVEANPVVIAQLRLRYAKAADDILAAAIDGTEEVPEEPEQERLKTDEPGN